MKAGAQIVTALFVVSALVFAPPAIAAWISDGVAVIIVTGTQDQPAILADGAGGAIIVWRDNRTVNTDIYAQRVAPDGALLWLATGMPICTASNSQSLPLAVSDGAGGAIVVWQDFRSGNLLDIYAQRINSSGYIQWDANGVALCTGRTGMALGSVIADGAGGAIVAWHDRRNASIDIFVQRISASGAVLWTEDGVNLCAATASQMYPVLAPAGTGEAIVAWQDGRSGFNDIYAQRVSSAGVAQWTADGVVVCGASQYQASPQILPDGSGGAVVAWSDHRNTVDYDVYAQRVDGTGGMLWTANGVAVSATTGNQMSCRIAPAAAGATIVTWIDYRGSDADIYAQKLDGTGAPGWAANGVPVCTAAGNQNAVQLVPDGRGTVIAAWEDSRDGVTAPDVYSQRINADGTPRWTADGVAVCQAAGLQTTVQLAPDSVGGAIHAWRDDRSGNADIYAQRVDAAGHTVTATLLESFAAGWAGNRIEISWILSEWNGDNRCFILRADAAAQDYRELPPGGIRRDGRSFVYFDDACEPGQRYRYRVDIVDKDGRRVLFETGIVDVPRADLALHQNRPNPFNPSTTVAYYLPEPSRVRLEVFDANGRLVKRLDEGFRSAGAHETRWDGTGSDGRRAASGCYFCRLSAGKRALSRTMVLVR